MTRLEESLEILSDPALVAAIRVGLAEADRGEFATEAEIRADLGLRVSEQ